MLAAAPGCSAAGGREAIATARSGPPAPVVRSAAGGSEAAAQGDAAGSRTAPAADGGSGVAVGPPAAAEAVPPLARLALADLHVTSGALRSTDEGLLIDGAKFRAVARRRTAQIADLDFTYLGPTEETAPLASGAVRRQLGLKLRAADGCNLVYAMWRFEPRAEVVVQIKRNPGARTHAECGARGYSTVRPRVARRVEAPRPGERHRLQAALDGDRLAVRIDGAIVWEGDLGAGILAFDGPVGLRSDNVRAILRLHVPAAP